MRCRLSAIHFNGHKQVQINMKMKSYLVLLLSTLIIYAGQPMQEASAEEDPRMAGFKGKIAKTFDDSVEDWPGEPTFTGEEPNVLVILLDDVGYGHLEPYGGLTDTPNIDKMAKQVLLYNNFHTTALCSPSRAAILAGRNSHSIGLGSNSAMLILNTMTSGKMKRRILINIRK